MVKYSSIEQTAAAAAAATLKQQHCIINQQQERIGKKYNHWCSEPKDRLFPVVSYAQWKLAIVYIGQELFEQVPCA